MYRINKKPGEAAKAKGHACYPEDLEIETILEGAALLEGIKKFEKQEESK